MTTEAAGRWGLRTATSLVSKGDAADVEELFAARRRGESRREAELASPPSFLEAELCSPPSFLEASRLTEGRALSSSWGASPSPSFRGGRQERLRLDGDAGQLSPGDGGDLGGALSGAALAAGTMMESARRVAAEVGRDAPVAARRPRALDSVGRVVGRLCDGAQRERLRACLAGWTLLASRKAPSSAASPSSEELRRQQEAETARRLELSDAKTRELAEQLGQQRKSSALLSDMAARRVSALEAELAKLREAGAAAKAIDPGGGGGGRSEGRARRNSSGEPFQVCLMGVAAAIELVV